jgi:spore maturation protein CgeB
MDILTKTFPSSSLPASDPTKKGKVRRIIYVGDTWNGSTSGMRLETLLGLGHSVQAIPRPGRTKSVVPSLFGRMLWRIGVPRDYGLNRVILDSLARGSADVLWCDRPLDIKAQTLETAKKMHPLIKSVAYSLDDMGRSHNQSAYYLRSIPLYDLHVTTKSYNVGELKSLGARNVLFVNNAFSPRVHFPLELTPQERQMYGGQVGFIGGYERERAEMLVSLAKEGIPVRIWGGWPRRLRSSSPNLRIEDGCVWGEAYRLAINSFDINLCFLRKINRDVQTTRSVEIPSCGGFLLAERTGEHLSLFREDVEAAYFSSTDELLTKVTYYLENESLRKTIAMNGFRRALSIPYTYEAQLEYILKHI